MKLAIGCILAFVGIFMARFAGMDFWEMEGVMIMAIGLAIVVREFN